MSQHKVTTTWAGQLAFDSQIDRHTVRIDGEHTPETDTGPGPKSLLLTALTGCSAIAQPSWPMFRPRPGPAAG